MTSTPRRSNEVFTGLLIAGTLSALGAVIVLILSGSVGNALTAGVIGLVIGGAIFALNLRSGQGPTDEKP